MENSIKEKQMILKDICSEFLSYVEDIANYPSDKQAVWNSYNEAKVSLEALNSKLRELNSLCKEMQKASAIKCTASYSIKTAYQLMQEEKRAKEFLCCLGNGKSIYEVQDE